MTVLVTGGSGMLGSRLVELLRERDHDVREGRNTCPDHAEGKRTWREYVGTLR